MIFYFNHKNCVLLKKNYFKYNVYQFLNIKLLDIV